MKHETLAQYTTRLVRKNKVRMLARGVFAGVFQHPSRRNLVVKVFDDRDTEYQRYLRFALKHQGNRWLPQVLDHVITEGKDTQLHLVFMEKLKPTKPECAPFRDAASELEQLLPEKEEVLDHFIEFGELDFTRSEWRRLAKVAEQVGHDIAPFASFMSSTPNHDLHYGNIMRRKDGQVVFTDPVATNVTTMSGEKIGGKAW